MSAVRQNPRADGENTPNKRRPTMVYEKVADREARLKRESEATAPTIAPTTTVAEPPKIKVKRDWSKKDKLACPPEYFKKYPNMHPVWVRRVPEDMDEKEGEGYEYPTLTKEERKSKGPLAQGTSETSHITRGDLILMHIPIEDYEDKLASETEPIRQRQKHIAESGARSNKLRGITTDTSEILEDN